MATAPAHGGSELLPRSVLLCYALPGIALSFSFLLIGLYFLKYATDVLLIAPALMGLLFAVSRFWDGLADPLAGYLSDRTRTRLGRRRSWLVASALPFGLSLWLLWSPPAEVTGVSAAVWVGVGLFLFYTAYTAYAVPYGALGMELTQDYHDRTRLFAWRQAIGALGLLFGVGAYYLLLEAERGSAAVPSPRALGMGIGLFASLAICAGTLALVLGVGERSEYQQQRPTRVFGAFGDVLKNPYARRLLVVQCMHYVSIAALSLVSAYLFQYVLRVPSGTAALLVACFAVGTVAAIPLWVVLSRRFDKHRCWSAALWCLGIAYGLLYFVLGERIASTPSQLVVTALLTTLLGALQSSQFVLSNSMQADVVDWDEERTGERKEGAYLAVLSFAEKCSAALAAAAVGFVLEWVGYAPGREQNHATHVALLALASFVPAVCHFVAALLLTGFGLGEQEHARIRAVLQARARRRAMTELPTPLRAEPGRTRIGWIGTRRDGRADLRPSARRGLRADRDDAHAGEGRPAARTRRALGRDAREVAVAERRGLHAWSATRATCARSCWAAGRARRLRPGGILVDMTTSEPSLAIEIAAAARARGCHALDAPVSGGDVGAREARLSIMVGGDAAAVEARAAAASSAWARRSCTRAGRAPASTPRWCNQTLIAGEHGRRLRGAALRARRRPRSRSGAAIGRRPAPPAAGRSRTSRRA